MGYYAAECMLAAETTSDSSHFCLSETPSTFAFELFAHVTKFFGYKVSSVTLSSNCNFIWLNNLVVSICMFNIFSSGGLYMCIYGETGQRQWQRVITWATGSFTFIINCRVQNLYILEYY